MLKSSQPQHGMMFILKDMGKFAREKMVEIHWFTSILQPYFHVF